VVHCSVLSGLSSPSFSTGSAKNKEAIAWLVAAQK